MSFGERRKLARPGSFSVRPEVFTRCGIADTEFYDATKRALLKRVKKFPELMADAESPTEVLQYMDSLENMLTAAKQTGLHLGLYSRENLDYCYLCSAVETRVLGALKRYFVAYAAENVIGVDDAYRALWEVPDSSRKLCNGFRVLEPFHTISYQGSSTYRWKAIFLGLFEAEEPPVKRIKEDE